MEDRQYQMSVRLTPELRAHLERLAATSGRTLSNVIREALRQARVNERGEIVAREER